MQSKGLEKVTSGYATWRWLSSIASKQSAWLLGSLSNRGGYEAWTVFLFRELQNPHFLDEFETTSDPWAKSKMIGQKISEISKEFKKLNSDEKAELAKKGELELKTGLELLKNEKKRVLELLQVVTTPLDS